MQRDVPVMRGAVRWLLTTLKTHVTDRKILGAIATDLERVLIAVGSGCAADSDGLAAVTV